MGKDIVAINEFKLYNRSNSALRKGCLIMKALNLESKEFKRVMHNLHLENLSLSPEVQEKVLELINKQTSISSSLIKDILRHGKV